MSPLAATRRQANPSDNLESVDSITDLLGYVGSKGVRLWTEAGQLRYEAPKGALTHEEIERLRLSRAKIVALLEGFTDGKTTGPRRESRPRLNRVPLAFSQLAHWNLYQLSQRRAIRQIASATRLRGRLNIDALIKSIAEIVRRHDALRTRIVVLDGAPMQEIAESGACELRVDDLTAMPENLREAEVIRTIEQHILEPIDVAADSLFGARLLRIRDDEHVLILAMEHMISDAFSMGILSQELFTAYMQTSKGRAFSLPAIPIQFADYAIWQRNSQKSWIEQHEAYWNKRLAGCQRLRFPEDKSLQTASCMARATVTLRIERKLKEELREWCRLRRTTLVMSVFTAYVGLILRWCNVSESVIQYQSDGRTSPNIENTIGYFASALYLRIELLEDDSFVDLLNRVTVEYCKAYEHADFSCMAAQVPRPELTRNTLFNWVPQGSKLDLSDLDGSAYAISYSPVPFTHPMLKKLELDLEPVILLFDADDEIVGDVYFPLNRFSIEIMERFAHNFLVFIRALLRQPDGRVQDIALV